MKKFIVLWALCLCLLIPNVALAGTQFDEDFVPDFSMGNAAAVLVEEDFQLPEESDSEEHMSIDSVTVKWLNNQFTQAHLTNGIDVTFNIDNINVDKYTFVTCITKKHLVGFVISDREFEGKLTTRFLSNETSVRLSGKLLAGTPLYVCYVPYGYNSSGSETFDVDPLVYPYYPFYRTTESTFLTELAENLDQIVYSATPDLTPDDYLLSDELGYLTGLSDKSTYLKVQDKMQGTIVFVTTDEIYNFGWNGTSSSDLNFSDNDWDDVKIQLKTKVYGGYYDGYNNLTIPIQETREHDVLLDPRSFSYSWSKAEQLQKFQFYNDPYPTGYHRKLFFEFYFRLIGEKDGQMCRGPWVCLHPNQESGLFDDWMDDHKVTNVTTSVGDFDDEGSFVPDPGSESSGNINHGQGVSKDDALNNVEYQTNNQNYLQGINSFIPAMSALVTQIGAVPMVIASLFSFLPSWCLSLFALAFGFSCVLIVLKAVRG